MRYGTDTKKQANELIGALDRANALKAIETNDFLEMVRLSKMLRGIAVHDCNGTMTERMETIRGNAILKILVLTEKYGLKVNFSGDPRGFVVKVHASRIETFIIPGVERKAVMESAKSNSEMDVVIFRKFKDRGDIVALFPNTEADHNGNCMSYQHVGQHVGQHGAANYDHCISVSVPATTEEYAPLLKELRRIGYNLKVKSRRN